MVWTGFIFLLHHVIITIGRPSISTTSLCGTNGKTYKDEEKFKLAQSKEADLQLLHLGPCLTAVRESIIKNLNPTYLGDGQIHASLPGMNMEYVESKTPILEKLTPYYEDIMRIGRLRGELGNNRNYKPALYLPNRSLYHSSYQSLNQSPYVSNLRMSHRLTYLPLHKMSYGSPYHLKYSSDVKPIYPFNSQLHFVSRYQPSNSYRNYYYPNKYYLPHNIKENQLNRYDESLPGKFDWMYDENHWNNHKNPQRDYIGTNLKGGDQAEVVNAGVTDKGNKETSVGYTTENKFTDLTHGYQENKGEDNLKVTNNDLEPSVTPLRIGNNIYELPKPSQFDLLHRHPIFTLFDFLKSPPATKYSGFEDYLFTSTISHSYLHPIVKSQLLSKYGPYTLAGNLLILTEFVFPGSKSILQLPFEPLGLDDNILPLPESMPTDLENNLLHESSFLDSEIPDSNKNLPPESTPSRLQDNSLIKLIHPNLDYNERIITKADTVNLPADTVNPPAGHILTDQEDNTEGTIDPTHYPPLSDVLPGSEYDEGSSTDSSIYPLSGDVLPDLEDNMKDSTNTSQNQHVDDAFPGPEYDTESSVYPPSGNVQSDLQNNMKDQSDSFQNPSKGNVFQNPHVDDILPSSENDIRITIDYFLNPPSGDVFPDLEDNMKNSTNPYQNPSARDVFPDLVSNIKDNTNSSQNLHVEDVLPGSQKVIESSKDSSLNPSSGDAFLDSQNNMKDRGNPFQNLSAEDAFSGLDNMKDTTNPPQDLYVIDILPSTEDDIGSSIDSSLNPSSGDGLPDLEDNMKDTTNISQNLSAEDAFWDPENNTEDKRDPFSNPPLGAVFSSSEYNVGSSTDLSIITPSEDLLLETKDIIKDSKNPFRNPDDITGPEYYIESSVDSSSNSSSDDVLPDSQDNMKDRRNPFQNPSESDTFSNPENNMKNNTNPSKNPPAQDVFPYSVNNAEDLRDTFQNPPSSAVISDLKYNMESSTNSVPYLENNMKVSTNPAKNIHVGNILPDLEYNIGSSVRDVFSDPGDIKKNSLNNIRGHNMPSSNEDSTTDIIEEGLEHFRDLHSEKEPKINLDLKYLYNLPDYYFIFKPISVSQNSSSLGSGLNHLGMKDTKEGDVERSVEGGEQLNMEDNSGGDPVNNGYESKEYSEVGSLEYDDDDYHHQYITEVIYDEPCDIQNWFSK